MSDLRDTNDAIHRKWFWISVVLFLGGSLAARFAFDVFGWKPSQDAAYAYVIGLFILSAAVFKFIPSMLLKKSDENIRG